MSKKVANGTLVKFIHDNKTYNSEVCLLWPYGKYENGYGQMTVNGKKIVASRYMCIVANGEPESEKTEAAHTCGNGHLGCVNPKHLVWKNRKENEQDKLEHGTRCFGVDHGHSYLSEEDVLKIYELSWNSKLTQKQIALLFGTTQSTVSNIKRGLTWSHLTKKN